MDHVCDFLAPFFRHNPDFPQLLSLAGSAHGRVREEAVRRIGTLRTTEALPALIGRINDWVPQVRYVAREAIEALMVEENAPAFVQNLVSLQRLLARGRDDHATFVARIEAFLAAAPQRRYVLEATRSPDRHLSGHCLRLAVKYALVNDVERVELGLLHGDIAFALDAVAHAATLPSEQRRLLAERALTHAFAPVRRDALRLLLSDGIEQERVVSFAFDRHAAVRALAARHLKNDGFDIAAHYRAELTSPHSRRQRMAIEGVASYGTAEDLHALRALLTARSPAIRRCALVAWTVKRRFDAVDEVVAAMSDPATSVAHQAARLAEIACPQFDADAMLALSASPTWAENNGPLLSAFRYSDKWERLIFALQWLTQTCRSPEHAGSMLRYWEAHTAGSSIAPRATQVARIQQLIDQGGPDLTSALRRARFDFLLVSIGIEFTAHAATKGNALSTTDAPALRQEAPQRRPGLAQRFWAWWRQP
ncbi:MAG: hypothetical protein AMXMBFR59_13310 [Rhodanobacteraceae bacterium]